MANFYAQYPASSGGSNPSVGSNGLTAPTSSTEVGGINPSGNLQPLKTDASGNLLVDIASPVIFTNAAIGLNGAPAPTSSIEIGGIDPGGNLKAFVANSVGDLQVIIDTANQPGELAVSATINNADFTGFGGALGPASPVSFGSVNAANEGIVTLSSFVGTATFVMLGMDPAGNFTIPIPTLQLTGTGVNGIWTTAGMSAAGNYRVKDLASAENFIIQTASGTGTAVANITVSYGSGGQRDVVITGPIGQALSASSIPVVLPAAQITALTPLSSVTVTQAIGTNLHTVVDSSALPTGAATSALQSNVQSAPGSAASTAITVQGSASGTAIPVSGTVAISGTISENLTQVGGSAIALGQHTMAASLPVVISSDQSTINIAGIVSLNSQTSVGTASPASVLQVGGVDGSGNIQPLAVDTTTHYLKVDGSNVTQPVSAASLPLPTGAATAANQTNVQSAPGTSATTALTIQGSASGVAIPISGTVTVTPSGEQNVNLNQVGGSAIAIGQQLSAASLPVVLPAAQITALTPPTTVTVTQATGTNLHTVVDSSALPTGAATSALQSSVQGPVTPGTAATNSSLVGAVYNTTNPSPTNGQQVSLQVDQFSNLETVAPDLIVTGQSAQTAVVNNILTTTAGTAATLVDNYKSASVQVVSTGTGGTFIFEGSNDNVNFQTIPVFNQAVVTGTAITAAITATASQIVYVFPLQTNYIRLRIATTITGGSIQAFSRFTQATWAPNVFPVAQATAANLNVTVGSGTITTVSTVTNSNTGFPGIIADVASVAITTTTTTAAFTPTFGSSYLIDIPVTVVTGTTPTYQVTVQESADSGTNWYNVYAFPTITATGSYTSPVITMTGNRVRYVQTLTGTTPSFTRAINRLQSSQAGYNVPTGGILTDASGTTSATPSTSTQIMAANSFRKYLLIENVSANTMWINFTTAANASQPSFELLPGGSLVMESGFCSGEAVNVLSASASQAYTAKWA